jgi:hypothetical protein
MLCPAMDAKTCRRSAACRISSMVEAVDGGVVVV